eukprot:Selendium_serpulae@DN6482_c0_g1_i1.p3
MSGNGAAIDDFRDTVDNFGQVLVEWFNPKLRGEVQSSVVVGMPLTRFSTAMVVFVAYLAFVFITPQLINMVGRMAAEPKRGGQQEVVKKKSVADKFRDEPILMIQMIYNAGQVLLCAYMMSIAIIAARSQDYSFACNSFQVGSTITARTTHVFYMSKVFDFCDTAFIIARQKWRQLSFLHVYHHSSVFLFYWLNVNAAYDGDAYLPTVLNSFVHFVMYGYYFLTTLNVHVPMWIKASITKLQLIQFFILVGQAFYLLGGDCPFPPRVSGLYLGYLGSLIYLFLDFSKKEYSTKKQHRDDVGVRAKKQK